MTVRAMAYEGGSSGSIATLAVIKADYSEVSKGRHSELVRNALHRKDRANG
jgi:hypothetical protein